MPYNEDLELEKHKEIDKTLKEHGERLDGHDNKFESINTLEATHSQQIVDLCRRLDKFATIMMLMLGSLVGFFFYAIEKKII